MPDWLRPLMGRLMPKIGPKGLELARARLVMTALEAVLHLRRQHPKRVRHMVPQHVRRLVAAYDLRPTVEERRRDGGVTDSRPSAEL